MNKIEQKSRVVQTPKKKVERFCLKCEKAKDESDFYTNKDWTQQLGRDIWCKACIKKLKVKAEIQEYMWVNNREWNESLWASAERKAKRMIVTNAVYLKADDDMKAAILEQMCCNQVPNFMSSFYRFEDHKEMSFDEAIEKGLVILDDNASNEEEEKVYSPEFNGMFTKQEVEYLESYYNKLEEDFNFDNENARDYARKLCKASLAYDKAQAAYSSGKIPFSEVKDAMQQFDTLSKSSNIAACKRKAGESSGLTCWAETTMKLITTGHIIQNKVQYEKDVIDEMRDDLMHIIRANGTYDT